MATMSWICEEGVGRVSSHTYRAGPTQGAEKPLVSRSAGRGVPKAGKEKTSRRRFFYRLLTEERQDTQKQGRVTVYSSDGGTWHSPLLWQEES